jgi:hypothetical protein
MQFVDACRAGIHPGRELTFVLLGALHLSVRSPSNISPSNIFVMQFSLDNAPHERCFCGGPALFLWKLCARFQNRRGLRRLTAPPCD